MEIRTFMNVLVKFCNKGFVSSWFLICQVILAILFKDIFQRGKSLIQKEDLDAAVRKVQEKSVSLGKVCLLLVPKETLRQQVNNIPDSS